MLILQRKVGQSIMIGDTIEVTVTRIVGRSVKLGIKAPQLIAVMRPEVLQRDRDMDREQKQQ